MRFQLLTAIIVFLALTACDGPVEYEYLKRADIQGAWYRHKTYYWECDTCRVDTSVYTESTFSSVLVITEQFFSEHTPGEELRYEYWLEQNNLFRKNSELGVFCSGPIELRGDTLYMDQSHRGLKFFLLPYAGGRRPASWPDSFEVIY